MPQDRLERTGTNLEVDRFESFDTSVRERVSYAGPSTICAVQSVVVVISSHDVT